MDTLPQKIVPGAQPLPGFGGYFEHFGLRSNLVDIVEGLRALKIDGEGEVDLANQHHVRSFEQSRIFQRFILTLGDRKQNHAQIFAQVERRRTHQVANILNHQKVQAIQVHFTTGPCDHVCFQMANGARGDLDHGDSDFLQAAAIVVGGQIANDDSTGQFRFEIP